MWGSGDTACQAEGAARVHDLRKTQAWWAGESERSRWSVQRSLWWREAGDTLEKWGWGWVGPKLRSSSRQGASFWPPPWSYPQPWDGSPQEAGPFPLFILPAEALLSNLGMQTSRKFFLMCNLNKFCNNSNSFSVVLSNHLGELPSQSLTYYNDHFQSTSNMLRALREKAQRG